VYQHNASVRMSTHESYVERDIVEIIGNSKILAFYYIILRLVVFVRHSPTETNEICPSIISLGLRRPTGLVLSRTADVLHTCKDT